MGSPAKPKDPAPPAAVPTTAGAQDSAAQAMAETTAKSSYLASSTPGKKNGLGGQPSYLGNK